MNAIKSLFNKIVSFFKSPKLDQTLATVYDVLQTALPIVELIASMTPTRADDEIIAVIKQFAVPVTIPPSPMTDLEKSTFLRTAAATAVKAALGKVGVSDSVVNAAVELAVLTMKSQA